MFSLILKALVRNIQSLRLQAFKKNQKRKQLYLCFLAISLIVTTSCPSLCFIFNISYHFPVDQ
ncbi:hypothetical protein BY458DRAFT_499838 [Sporodiniella umbellata]|nr:hypothetical protein BY458DRAFT_499838 [Sporodiniella umbellata]